MEASLPPLPLDAGGPAVPVGLGQRLWAIACHLCLFVGGPFVFPFVVWLVARQDWPFVGLHAREALNFHLSLLIYALALLVLALPLVLSLVGIPVLIAAFMALGLGPLILAVLAAVRASESGVFQYPLTLRIFR